MAGNRQPDSAPAGCRGLGRRPHGTCDLSVGHLPARFAGRPAASRRRRRGAGCPGRRTRRGPAEVVTCGDGGCHCDRSDRCLPDMAGGRLALGAEHHLRPSAAGEALVRGDDARIRLVGAQLGRAPPSATPCRAGRGPGGRGRHRGAGREPRLERGRGQRRGTGRGRSGEYGGGRGRPDRGPRARAFRIRRISPAGPAGSGDSRESWPCRPRPADRPGSRAAGSAEKQ